MPKKKQKIQGGVVYYRKMGLTKTLTLHLSKKVHQRLKDLSKFEERSIQTIIRRCVDEYVGKNWAENKRMKKGLPGE